MDIENLTKEQVILLTLLISFVTSTATGIVTVSLLVDQNEQQAPIQNTINKIVQHTKEVIVRVPQKNHNNTANVQAVLPSKKEQRDEHELVYTISNNKSYVVARGILLDDLTIRINNTSLDTTKEYYLKINSSFIPLQYNGITKDDVLIFTLHNKDIEAPENSNVSTNTSTTTESNIKKEHLATSTKTAEGQDAIATSTKSNTTTNNSTTKKDVISDNKQVAGE